jgi:hypothetical protein
MKTYSVTFERIQQIQLNLQAFNKRDLARLLKLLGGDERRLPEQSWGKPYIGVGQVDEIKEVKTKRH